jgi:cytochrome c553
MRIRPWCFPARSGLAVALWPALGLVFAACGASADEKTDPAVPYVAMCTGCHTIPGYQASFPRVYRVPKIGGQSAQYIAAALQEYKKGERNHPTMTAVAKGLTDDQITLVAGYFAARGAAAK